MKMKMNNKIIKIKLNNIVNLMYSKTRIEKI